MKTPCPGNQVPFPHFCACLLAGIFLGTLAACSSTGSSSAGLDEPRPLLEASVKAYGGEAVMLHPQDLTFESEINFQQGDAFSKGWAKVTFAPPDRLLSRVRFESGDEKTVFCDGTRQGERINGKATDRDVTADLLKRRRTLMIHAFFLEDGARGVTLTQGVDEKGRRCAVLAKETEGETWKLWIDGEQFRIRKIRLVLHAGDPAAGIPGPLTVDWQYADFERMDGRLVPRTSRVYLNGKQFQKGRVTSFALNRGLGPEAFDPDSATTP